MARIRDNTKILWYGEIQEPERRLIIAIIARASKDAENGSMEALLWLATFGVEMMDVLGIAAEIIVREWCERRWRIIENGEALPSYAVQCNGRDERTIDRQLSELFERVEV